MKPEELKERYGESESGNFYVADTLGVPHPFCITPQHVTEAADHHGGTLTPAAIEACEKGGRSSCGMRGCNLSYKEHEQALVVNCKLDMQDGNHVNPELQTYLLASKEKAEADNFAGFAFKDNR
jgi:hypothetical protein